MSSAQIDALDLERHARQLRRALRADSPVALCDEAGAALWVSGDAQGQLAAALGRAADAEAIPAAASGRFACGAEEHLVWSEAVGPDGTSRQLVAWISGQQADLESGEIAAALGDAAAAVSTEMRLAGEVSQIADELAERYEELNVVYSFERGLESAGDSNDGGSELLQNLAEFLDLDFAGFVYPGGEAPVYATAPSAAIPNLDLVLTCLVGDILRFVMAARKPLVLNVADDPRRQYLLANMPYRVIATPVFLEGRVQAVMVLIRSADGADFTNGDRSLSEVIARQAGALLGNRRAYSAMARFSEQMAASLIEAIEAKDPYTRGHSERVQNLATRLASAADLLADDVESVSWAALLHDVGKLGIPDAILCKAGRLTQDEFTMIKIHPERGFEILRHIDALGETTRNAVRYHHERFDGTGYPHRLKGLSIPAHARVIAVADSYDAMTSSRSYRPGQSREVALAELVRVAGTQLDPQFVEVFERMCTEPGFDLADGDAR